MQKLFRKIPFNRTPRAALAVAALLLLATALLRPLAPALASCGGPTVVTTEAELTDAIDDYNGQAGPCEYTIAFGADITLTGDLIIVGNTTAGVEMTIDGAGFTLHADGWAGFHAEGGVLTVEDLTISDASIEAIFADSQVTLRVERVYLTGGITGIYLLDSQGVITDSTIADNVIGIQHYRSNFQPVPQLLTVINSTVAGNVAAGIEAGSNDLTVTNTTVTGSDTGVYVSNAIGVINNSILAGNGSDCGLDPGTIDVNFSLVENDSPDFPCGVTDGVDGNSVGEAALLLPLGDYGGPTPTMQPVALSGGVTAVSPVLDAGDNDLAVDENDADLDFDQRGAGFPRVVNTIADMGAVEGAFELECPAFPITVVDQAELNEAILCYNYVTTAGVYTIELDANIDLTASTLAIDNATAGVSLVIEGNGNTIDGQDTPGARPLTIEEDAGVTLDNATLTGGNVNGVGGGILNQGDLTLNQVNVTGNSATNDGGGIYNEEGATLALNNSMVDQNRADAPNGDGGGIANNGEMTITDSAVTGNTAEGEFGVLGGGILNDGAMTIVRGAIAGNTVNVAEEDGRGGGIANDANLIIRDSVINQNVINGGSDLFGGGVYSAADPFEIDDEGYGVQLVIINTTISDNGLDGGNIVYGGGLYATDYTFCCFDDPVPVTLINTTLAANSLIATDVDFDGGGAYFAIDNADNARLAVTMHNSILADNATDGAAGGDCAQDSDVVFESFHSLYEDTDDGACGLAAANPDADGNIVGQDPALGPLGPNGGLTLTHLPAGNSEAVDAGDNDLAVDENGDDLDFDQRGAGFPRVVGGTVDMGAVEVEDGRIFMSTTATGTTGDGLAFGPEDVLQWDGSAWSLWFDGSAAGLMPFNARHNINAFWIPDPDGNDLLLSFAQNRRFIPGIAQPVDGMDLIMWGGDDFSFWFDGSDVGLTNKTAEKIDGLHVLDGDESPINGGACLFYLLISTQGTGKVPNHSGGTLKFRGEDVVGFCATSLGETTAGLWHMVLDGSTQGMPANSTDSISLSDDGETMYLTTKGTFNVDAATGGHSMVYRYDFDTGEFSGPDFIAADEGLEEKVNGLHVEGDLP